MKLMKGISEDRDWGGPQCKQERLKVVRCEHFLTFVFVSFGGGGGGKTSNPNWNGVTWPEAKVISYYSQFLHFQFLHFSW